MQQPLKILHNWVAYKMGDFKIHKKTAIVIAKMAVIRSQILKVKGEV